MEKIIQRAKYAEKHVARRAAKRKQYLENTESWQRKQQAQRMARAYNQNLVAERRHRAEDWTLGPLAPRRDVGERAKSYGALNIYDFMPPDVDPGQRPAFVPRKMDSTCHGGN